MGEAAQAWYQGAERQEGTICADSLIAYGFDSVRVLNVGSPPPGTFDLKSYHAAHPRTCTNRPTGVNWQSREGKVH